MAIQRFEDIIAWQKAQDLAVSIYKLFRQSKDFGFRDQICKAAVSVSNNIAEGFERSSDADFVRFLYIAVASCSETRSMIYLAYRLEYININDRDLLLNITNEISKIIYGLIKSITKA